MTSDSFQITRYVKHLDIKLDFFRMLHRTITLTALLSFVAVVSSAGVKCSGTASYTLTFRGLWKLDRHPNQPLPPGAHFSPLIGCSHGSNYVMWREGGKASRGVESVAETG